MDASRGLVRPEPERVCFDSAPAVLAREAVLGNDLAAGDQVGRGDERHAQDVAVAERGQRTAELVDDHRRVAVQARLQRAGSGLGEHEVGAGEPRAERALVVFDVGCVQLTQGVADELGAARVLVRDHDPQVGIDSPQRRRDAQHAREVGADLGPTAPRQQDQRASLSYSFDLLLGRRRVLQLVEQRVTDVGRRHPLAPEELGLERQDRERRVDGASVAAHPPRAPGPVLRRDVVQHRHAAAAAGLGHHHVQAGVVDEHDEVRPVVAQQPQEVGVGPQDQRQLSEHADHAHHRVLAEAEAHRRAGVGKRRAAEGARAHVVAELLDQLARVQLAAGFAGRHEQVRARRGDPAAAVQERSEPVQALTGRAAGRRVQRLARGPPPAASPRQVAQQPRWHRARADQLARQRRRHLQPDHGSQRLSARQLRP